MFSRGPFSCARDDMNHYLRWTVFLWIVNSIPFTSGMAVNERIDHTCPSLKLEEIWHTSVNIHREFTGFDLAEKFLLRKGMVTDDRLLFRLGSKPLFKPTDLDVIDDVQNLLASGEQNAGQFLAESVV
ncbi:collagen alpha-1(XIX) chain-like [Rhinichthys klamathensis goyatoka]|uniref:collagen alpha-1(XIX) chain-like n=1 Tax=Rhinichthys klamathensis goyatoka TaxID=3034132 RepID=UPI0024B4A185|nr:collagen alpha-1(XIX) chain-like [Rhinichthys klamathensis goyatoka]